MKKLYTLALSAFVLAASASATAPTARMTKVKSAEALSELIESHKSIRTLPVTDLSGVKKQSAKAKAPAATPASIEELTAQKWDASYKGMLSGNSGDHSGDATFTYYAEYNYLSLTLPDYQGELSCGYKDGNLIIYPSVDYGTDSQGYKASLQPIDASKGALLNLTEPILIPFNEETGAFEFPEDFAWAMVALNPTTGDKAGYYWAGTAFTLSVSDGDFSLSVETPEVCNAENKYTFSVTLGADVAKAMYMVLPFDVQASEFSEYISSLGTECVAGQTYTVDPTKETAVGPIEESGYASVVFATYDAEGKLRKTTQQAFIVVLEGTEGWKNVGEIDYVDQLFAQYYKDFAHTQKAMLQAKEDQPGLYRIVEPYSEYEGYHSADCGHHYFMLNIADPEWVEVPFSVSGLDLAGDGILSFGTCVALGYDKETGTANGLTSGSLEGQTVTFPVESLFAHEQYYNQPGSWSSFNFTSEVTFTFPDINLNLTVVDADNAPVEGATVVLGEVSATTNAEGKATVKVPLETGYFATVKPAINGAEVEITLTGTETDYTYTIGQDGIVEITAEAGAKTVYNLRGQRVDKVKTPGIYIVNNRKVVVK